MEKKVVTFFRDLEQETGTWYAVTVQPWGANEPWKWGHLDQRGSSRVRVELMDDWPMGVPEHVPPTVNGFEGTLDELDTLLKSMSGVYWSQRGDLCYSNGGSVSFYLPFARLIPLDLPELPPYESEKKDVITDEQEIIQPDQAYLLDEVTFHSTSAHVPSAIVNELERSHTFGSGKKLLAFLYALSPDLSLEQERGRHAIRVLYQGRYLVTYAWNLR